MGLPRTLANDVGMGVPSENAACRGARVGSVRRSL